MENKTCKGCRWNHYPECYGTIMENSSYMKIDTLRSGFQCGVKDLIEPHDLRIKKKSDLEKRIDELEDKVKELEKEKE